MAHFSKKPIDMVSGVYRTQGLYKKCSPKDVFIVCNSQTIDIVYPDWVTRCKLDQNRYSPIDLNMPDSIPRREDNSLYYAQDPPLSEFGLFSANLVGRQLKESQAEIHHIYCSPQLQSVQTASEIKRHFKESSDICIEQELLSRYVDPKALLSAEKLVKCGFPVQVDYEGDQVSKTDEDLEKAFSRIIQSFQNIVDEQDVGSTLFVVDATVMKLLVDYCAGNIGHDKNCYLNCFDLCAVEKKAKLIYPPACTLRFGWTLKNESNKPVMNNVPENLPPITCVAGCTFPLD